MGGDADPMRSLFGGHTVSEVASAIARAIEQGRVPTDSEVAKGIEARGRGRGLSSFLAPLASDEGAYSRLTEEIARHIDEIYRGEKRTDEYGAVIELGQEWLKRRLAPLMDRKHNVRIDHKPDEYFLKKQAELLKKKDTKRITVFNNYLRLGMDFIDATNAADLNAEGMVAAFYFFFGIATMEYYRKAGVNPPPFIQVRYGDVETNIEGWYAVLVEGNIRQYLEVRQILAIYSDVFAPKVRLETGTYGLEKITEMLTATNRFISETVGGFEGSSIAELAPSKAREASWRKAIEAIDITTPTNFYFKEYLDMEDGAE